MSINDPRNSPPTAQTQDGGDMPLNLAQEDWLRLAQDAYRSSTSYVDMNLRRKWDDGLRAFNSQHAADSKYNSATFEKRSHLYRPKIRTITRKNEAASAAAFFSSNDVISTEGADPSNKQQQAAAEVMKQLIQYRLTHSIPWFHVVQGGLQEAQNTGAVCAHIYWEYVPAKDETVEVEPHGEEVPEGENEYPEQGKLPEGAFAAEEKPKLAIEIEVKPEPEQSMGLSQVAPPAQALPSQADGGLSTTPPQQVPPKPVGNQPPVQPEAAQAPMPTKRKGPKPKVDKPCVDLVALENLRIDVGADWTDPINSSPFLIHLIPMYVMDVKGRMEVGEWEEYSDGVLATASETTLDSTRAARQNGAGDQYDVEGKAVSDYQIVWVHRHIHRRDGEDWEFYMLGDKHMLSAPRLLSETVLHGMRPYELGVCVLEAHKIYSSTYYALAKNLVDEANEIANQRIDNVKFVLNKKYLVKRGQGQDLAGLVRNVPGGVVQVNDPQTDVKELTWPDVTASSYEEQSRIDNDMSDLLGNFSAAQVMADHGINGPAHNMAMLGQSAGTLVEYTLRTYVETFIQRVLRQIVKLEQAYETDEVVMALAQKKAKLFQKFGIDEVTDDLLEQDLTLNVNVGMGATDPQLKTQKFMAAISMFATVAKEPPLGLNMQEVGKELFGHLGYSDGSRFFTNDNPQVAQLQNQIVQLQQMIMKLKAGTDVKVMGHQVKVKTAELAATTKAHIAQQHEENENLRAAVGQKAKLVDSEKNRVHALVMHRLQSQQEKVNHVSELTMRQGNGKQPRGK